MRRKAYGNLGKCMQKMLHLAQSPAEVMNIPPAAFRNPEVNRAERKWLDRSKTGRFQASHGGKRKVKILRM